MNIIRTKEGVNNIKAVYMIKNNKNNKMYIGQTKDFKNRKREHLQTALCKNSQLYIHPL